MVINLHTDSCRLRKSRNNEHGSELQSCRYYFLSETSQVVLVSLVDFFNQAMHSETFEDPGDLVPGFANQNGAKRMVLKSMDMELSPDDAFEQFQVLPMKEVKSAITAFTIRYGLGDLFKMFDAHGGIFEHGNKLQVPSVCRFHQFPKNREAVDGFLQRGILHFPGAVPVFYLPVVFEKADIVDGRFDAQNHPQFVIHLNRNGTHVMLNPSPFDSGMEIITDLSLIGSMEFSSQEGRYVLGFDGVDCGTDDRFIERAQIALVFENHIRGKLSLHQAPMIPRREMPNDGTEHFCQPIQSPMECFDLEGSGELLGLREILHLDEAILQKAIGKTLLAQKTSQMMVPVKIELQPEGSPGGYAQIAQPQIFKDEVKIVVDTLGFRASEKRPARLLVMPGFERRTGLQGGEDMDQSGMIPTLGDDLLDPSFLTEILLSDKFDLQTILPSQTLRLETDFVAQGFGKLGVIENPNALGPQVATHRIGITDIAKGPRDDDPIEARENSSDFSGISFCQCSHGCHLLRNSQKDSLFFIEEKHEKVNPYLVSRCSITPAFSSAPFSRSG